MRPDNMKRNSLKANDKGVYQVEDVQIFAKIKIPQNPLTLLHQNDKIYIANVNCHK